MDYEIQKSSYTKEVVKVFFVLIDFIVLLLSLFCKDNITNIAFLFLINYFILFSSGLRYGKRFLVSPICLFFSFFFFYANTFPILFEFGGINFFSVKESSLIFTYKYSLKFLSLTVLLFCCVPKLFILDFSIDTINRHDLSFLLVFFAFIVFFMEIIYFVFSGYLQFFINKSTARTDINTYIRHYNIWIYLGYIDIFLLLNLFFSKSGKQIKKIIILLPVLFYYAINIFSGSRKQLLYIIIILSICHFLKIIRIKKMYFFIILFLFALAVFYRTIIMDKGFQGNVFSKVASVSGEFIFPTITFPLSLQKNFGSNNFNYPTLFDSVLYFVPRMIFPLKNYSMGETFSRMMDVNMGFAMNPMLEAYVNFGQFGYAFEVCLIVLIFSLIKKLAKNRFYLYIFSMIFLIDLNRGEISFYIRQILTIIITLYFITLLIQYLSFALKYNNKNSF